MRARSGVRPHPGDLVSVMLRPEQLTVAETPTTDGRSVAGTVSEMIFQGSSTRLEMELPDGTMVVAQAGSTDETLLVRPGAELHLHWSPGAAYLLEGWPTVGGATSVDVDDVEASL